MASETRYVLKYDVCSGDSPATPAAQVGKFLGGGWVPFESMVAHSDPNSATEWRYHQATVVYGEVIP